MRQTIFTILTSLLFISHIGAATEPVLPKVFILGEHEQEYEKLVAEYETTLLAVCNNDMQGAFKKWISMLKEMEVYANQIEYDINGTKFWLHVFWENDGSIKHIAYHLRPNSRNVDTKELSAFLSSFMNHYRFPLTTDSKYSHYSSAYFPLTTQRTKKN